MKAKESIFMVTSGAYPFSACVRRRGTVDGLSAPVEGTAERVARVFDQSATTTSVLCLDQAYKAHLRWLPPARAARIAGMSS